jgi:alanine racemase
MSLVSQVSMVKELASGDGVSYGHVWRAPTDTTIAIAPIGYADGIARNAGRNAMSVLIAGRRCPIVGNVTMDQLMVDVGQLVDRGTPVAPGDPVVLIGSQGAESIGAWEWGLARDSLAYEVVCAVGERVPRRYLERA